MVYMAWGSMVTNLLSCFFIAAFSSPATQSRKKHKPRAERGGGGGALDADQACGMIMIMVQHYSKKYMGNVLKEKASVPAPTQPDCTGVSVSVMLWTRGV